jgi:gluconate 2-dehydrogenase gamma chain
MVKIPSIDRRRLLLGAAPVAAAVISGLGSSPSSAEAAPAYSPTFFSAEEWAFVRAAVGRLIPSEGPGPGGIEAGVPEFIDRQMEMPYGHGAYFYLTGPFQTDVPS